MLFHPIRRPVDRTRRMGALAIAWLACLVLSCSLAEDSPTPAPVEEASSSQAADTRQPERPAEITYDNLWENDLYWPYNVRFTEDWTPEDSDQPSFSYATGVLVRVEQSGDLRIGFGRFGNHVVPARVTNVLEGANKVLRGEEEKPVPNFVRAILNKTVEPSTEAFLDPFTIRRRVRAYVVVLEDPTSPRLAELAAAIEPLHDRPDVIAILFPQGHERENVLEMVKASGWNLPFVHPRFSGGYTRAMFGEDLELPLVFLQSPDGRIMTSGPWAEAMGPRLAATIDQELGPAPRSASSRASAAEAETRSESPDPLS